MRNGNELKNGGVKMALINCPECGVNVSDRANSCPHCGCPLGPGSNGVLKIRFTQNTVIPSASFSVRLTFDGQTETLYVKGSQSEFIVPNDGKIHILEIHCKYGIHVYDCTFEIKPGESRWYSVEYYKGVVMGDWRIHDYTDRINSRW